jgi:transposase
MGCQIPVEGNSQLSEAQMRYVGIDLHKRSLTVCVFDKTTGETLDRRFFCGEQKQILKFFKDLGHFEAVMEATATYEWLWELLEPTAQRLLLAHPKKIRIIAESMKKTDKHDAYFLAWLLSINSVPEAHRPTPRQREYQHLVKHRSSFVSSRSRLMTQVRSILAAKNLDHKSVFTRDGRAALSNLKLSSAEKYRLEELLLTLDFIEERIKRAAKQLAEFRSQSSESDKKLHSIVKSVPGVGDLTADIVLSTLGDVTRFPNAKKCTAYAGVVPGFRESDNKRHELGITKEGPRILRWALVQAAWRAVQFSDYWKNEFEKISARRGKKKAVVAIARRLLVVIYSLMKKGEPYKEKLRTPTRPPQRPNGKMKLSA